MLLLRTHARALSLLGVIITLLLLFGVSCGSGSSQSASGATTTPPM
jgi:hypothetical protein